MTNKLLLILSAAVLMLCGSTTLQAKGLVGKTFKWTSQDTVFQQPYIDEDVMMTSAQGLKVHYVHGGFADGTMFSFYFPAKKKEYKGRFFQYITPFPTTEKTGIGLRGDEEDMASFAVSHGAYFIETNEGGILDFSDPSTRRESSISAYRANAACAEFSREVAKRLFGTSRRPYGYCFGGSGGAYRTTGSMEMTNGVWDGAVPFVLGSPNAIPNVFSVRMNALRVLHDKLPMIVDALEVGGDGHPEKGLNAQERAVWEETCKMGFPKQSWYGFRYMDQHGFVATYSGCCAMDPAYFSHDFWEKPGYEGYEADSLLRANRIQQEGVILGFYDQEMCEKMQLVSPADDAGEGNADRATRNMGANNGQPRALALNTVFPDVFFMIGDLIIKSGEAKGETLQMHGVHDNLAVLSTVCPASTIAKLKVGDTVMVDNSRALAALYMHRHFIPGPEYYAWNQFRDAQGNPIPPQRPMLLGPIFTQGAGGCLPTGNINGKMILLESLWDREAYPWQADWYRNNIIKNKGQQFCDDNFRIWFTDRCTHGGVDDATQVISYMPIIQQALLDVADWAEKGIEPSPTTTYRVEDSQVIIPADATDRGGVQPSVDLTIEGKKRYETKVGQEVMVHVVASCPKGTGRIVRAELCLGEPFDLYSRGPKGNAAVLMAPPAHYVDIDLSKAQYSEDGTRVEFDVPVKYGDVGTYFPTVRVTNSRSGQPETFAQIQNVGRVRLIVEL